MGLHGAGPSKMGGWLEEPRASTGPPACPWYPETCTWSGSACLGPSSAPGLTGSAGPAGGAPWSSSSSSSRRRRLRSVLLPGNPGPVGRRRRLRLPGGSCRQMPLSVLPPLLSAGPLGRPGLPALLLLLLLLPPEKTAGPWEPPSPGARQAVLPGWPTLARPGWVFSSREIWWVGSASKHSPPLLLPGGQGSLRSQRGACFWKVFSTEGVSMGFFT